MSNVDYVIAELALYRMGYCACLRSLTQCSASSNFPGVFFLSPNNSPHAIAHLLSVTNTSHVFVQDAQIPAASEALTLLAESSVSIIRQPSPDVYGPEARAAHPDKTHWEPALSPEAEFLLSVNIIHSSGSTGFPKAVVTTNKAAVGSCRTNLGLTALTTMPLYHVSHAPRIRPVALSVKLTGIRAREHASSVVFWETAVYVPNGVYSAHVREHHQVDLASTGCRSLLRGSLCSQIARGDT